MVKMTKNKVFVTGGAGYIGSILVRYLLDSGNDVIIFERFMFGLDSIKDIINHPNLTIVIGDIRNNDDLDKAFTYDFKSVVHLAGIVGDPACAVNVNTTIETNYLATLRLGQLCRQKKIERFIFASTCSVYGASKGDNFLTESSIVGPISLYGESKLDAEKNILSLADENFNPTILRFSTVYGLSPRMRFDLVINFLAQKAVNEGNVSIFGGDQWRPFIHVTDIARAIEVVLDSPLDKITKQIFNVGSTKENYLMKDIGKLFEKLPSTHVDHINEIKDKRSYRVSCDKIKDVLGFETRKTVYDGIIEIAEAVKNGMFKDITNKKYYNYKAD